MCPSHFSGSCFFLSDPHSLIHRWSKNLFVLVNRAKILFSFSLFSLGLLNTSSALRNSRQLQLHIIFTTSAWPIKNHRLRALNFNVYRGESRVDDWNTHWMSGAAKESNFQPCACVCRVWVDHTEMETERPQWKVEPRVFHERRSLLPPRKNEQSTGPPGPTQCDTRKFVIQEIEVACVRQCQTRQHWNVSSRLHKKIPHRNNLNCKWSELKQQQQSLGTCTTSCIAGRAMLKHESRMFSWCQRLGSFVSAEAIALVELSSWRRSKRWWKARKCHEPMNDPRLVPQRNATIW